VPVNVPPQAACTAACCTAGTAGEPQCHNTSKQSIRHQQAHQRNRN
jgi:hypothetical protein